MSNELIVLFNTIGLERFSLVTYDWGSIIGDHIVSTIPYRVIKYIRMEAPVLKTDMSKYPQFIIFRNQEVAKRIMFDARAFVIRVYETRTIQKISEEDIEGVVREFGRFGVAESVLRYFRDFVWGSEDIHREMFQKMTFPVLVLQGEKDLAQPLWYYDDIESIFPNVKLHMIMDAGHFTELEKPQEVSNVILDFLAD